jgi:ribose/xylose/arabinose/galactoside ABC-type transport system permease subunit
VGRAKQTTFSQEGPIVAVARVVVGGASLKGIYRRSAQRVWTVVIVYVAPAQVEVGTFSVHKASSEYGF